jgi:UDP-N-acetylmuramate-alanine ligase
MTQNQSADRPISSFPYGRAHFIGIGGVGMSATAKLLRDSGVAVTGSDEGVYPPISDVLRDVAFCGVAMSTPMKDARMSLPLFTRFLSTG